MITVKTLQHIRATFEKNAIHCVKSKISSSEIGAITFNNQTTFNL